MKTSFSADEPNFLRPLMRFARGDARRPGAPENRWVKFEFAGRDFRVHIVDNNTAT
jgi:hypothetical protein